MIISKIADIIDQNDISLRELSKRMGITYKTALKIYYADITGIQISTLDSLCASLGTTPGNLFQYEPGCRFKKPVVNNTPNAKHPKNKRVKKSIVIPHSQECGK